MSLFEHALFSEIFPGFSLQKVMGLGALDARVQRAFYERKIIQIDLYILAGDGFEKTLIFILDNKSVK